MPETKIWASVLSGLFWLLVGALLSTLVIFLACFTGYDTSDAQNIAGLILFGLLALLCFWFSFRSFRNLPEEIRRARRWKEEPESFFPVPEEQEDEDEFSDSEKNFEK